MQKNKCQIRKDDKVKILAGKDKGKIGKVLRVLKEDQRIVVEKINIIKKHVRPGAQHRQGGIIESEGPIHSSNVVLICNKCMAQVRIKMKRLEDGKKKRVCRKCSEMIDA